MYEQLNILEELLKKLESLDDLNLKDIPDEHKRTSLDLGARCNLSYKQGYRDGIQSALSIIRVYFEKELDEFERQQLDMYNNSKRR
tara:strand:- start:131 stop:388 length:258 start_codon:yes stop_codon:yes gene_type:complete